MFKAFCDSALSLRQLAVVLGLAHACAAVYVYPPCPTGDPRCIPNGAVFSNKSNSYAEQPYCFVRSDDEWVCGLTYNKVGWQEGTPGEQMVSMHTHDRGLSWGPTFSVIEKANFGVDAAMTSSYGSVFGRADGTRLFAVYTFNSHNLTGIPGAKPNVHWRADMMGPYSLRYSDDLGENWSDERFEVPVPFTAVDRANDWNGTEHDGWEVDQVKTVNGTIMFAFTKIQKYCLVPPEEMYIAVSHDLLTVSDVGQATWEFWPNADHGLQPPGGNPTIGEEPHVVPLKWGGYQVLMRTSQGYMGSVVSGLDPRLPWSNTRYARYAPIKGPAAAANPLYNNNTWWVKQPRGPLTPKRQSNGMVLMSFNHNAGFASFAAATPIMDRCVIWLTAGLEDESSVHGELLWSQPELALYDPERTHDHGYPDIISTSDEKVYILETYKGAARVHNEASAVGRRHEVDSNLLAGLFAQRIGSKPSMAPGVAAAFTHVPELLPLPLNTLSADFLAGKHGNEQSPYRNGFSFDLWVTPATLPAQDFVLFKTTAGGNESIAVLARANGSLALELVDQNSVFVRWSTDHECTGALVGGGDVLHHVGIVADAGPNMILFTVDGKLCDGGRAKDWPAGWKLFDQAFGRPGGSSSTLEILPGAVGRNATKLVKGRVYGRALFVSELVANYRVGPL